MPTGFENMSVRFFIVDLENDDGCREVGEPEFLTHPGNITYERHTVFANGVSQICLTKLPDIDT